MAFIPPCNIYGSPLSDEEKEVYSKILDYQIHFHGEPRDLTCKFVARAYCQIRASKSKDVAVIFDDFDCMDLLLQLAHALLYLSEISRRVDAYNEVLTDISSVKLKPKKKDGIIRDVQSLVEGNLLGETGHEILQVVNQVFELNEADFKQIRKKVLDSFVAPKLGEKTKVVVDAQTQKINRSIRELYDQVEDDCSDDDEKIFGDEDEYFKNQIDALCSLVRFIFKHPIMEVETVAAILPYYPGFRQLGQEMMKYESDCICDSLIEGLFDGSCDCSTFQELLCPPVLKKTKYQMASTQASQASGSTQAKARAHFSMSDDQALCLAWIKISEDSIVGAFQNAKGFWNRVTNEFNQARGSDRSPDSISGRWKYISKMMNKFVAIVNAVEARHASGTTIQSRLSEARMTYQLQEKSAFSLDHCYVILKDNPKWSNVFEARSSRPTKGKGRKNDGEDSTSNSPSVGGVELEGSQEIERPKEMERPLGSKKAKSKRNQEKSFGMLEGYFTRLEDTFAQDANETQKCLELRERELAYGQRTVMAREEKNRIQAEKNQVQLEKNRLQKMQYEAKILATDTSVLHPDTAFIIEQQQAEIRAEWGRARGGSSSN